MNRRTATPMQGPDIVTMRAEIAALYAERATLQRANPSKEEVYARLRAFAVNVGTDVQRRAVNNIGAGDLADVFKVRTIGDTVDLGPLLSVLLGPDFIADRLRQLADRGIDYGPSEADKTARLVEIAAQLDRLERDEEALIVASEATATPIDRRGDARPDLVLAVLA